MTRKVITFLGRDPKDALYEWQGRTYPGKVFAQALREFVDFDEMLVFVTPLARNETFPVLAELQDKRIRPVDIVDGMDTESMWKIFQTVLDNVEEGETVIFDITHGFRSLPFLAFLFIAYLKSAKNVTIRAVYYGAFEMRKDGKTPVLDLSEFVTMLDWLTATEQFVQTGNARALSALLNPSKQSTGVLFEAANNLDNISQAARLCQPFTLMKEVGKLEQALRNAQHELQISAPPFEVLRSQIVNAFAQFQNDGQDVAQMLRTEFHLVQWYYQKGQVVQAVTLAREWLIDAVTYRLGQPLDFLMHNRDPFEKAISGVALLGKPHPEIPDSIFTENDLNRFGVELLKWAEIETMKQLWTDLKNVRNPLDHAEHQRKKEKEKTLQALNKLQNKIEKVMHRLSTLAEQWNLA
ncbi:MAG: TIGR02221 family CRISPR-associated protein [Anaerolineae bacterium]